MYKYATGKEAWKVLNCQLESVFKSFKTPGKNPFNSRTVGRSENLEGKQNLIEKVIILFLPVAEILPIFLLVVGVEIAIRGHSTTTWTEFCHFLTPPP